MNRLTLIEPADGAQTGPLQKHPWPDGGAPPGGEEGDGAAGWNALRIVAPDRSLPAPVAFGWNASAGGFGTTYDLVVSRRPTLAEPIVFSGLGRARASVWHLFVGTRYYWKQELGIRTDLDLRWDHEASPALDPGQVEWINVPVSPYQSIGDAAFKESYRRVFEIFADPARYPILFHCVGGADRAGTVAFLLSALLGKSREHLCRDYELTSLSIWGERSRLSEQFNALLGVLATYGGGDDVNAQVESYLGSIGVTPAALASIRRLLAGEPGE